MPSSTSTTRSFPSFKGARPYHQAWERGVKVIGATAHYATADLDEGPIIIAGVCRSAHQHSANMMVDSGHDIERRVLAQAVLAHLEHRIIIHGAGRSCSIPTGWNGEPIGRSRHRDRRPRRRARE